MSQRFFVEQTIAGDLLLLAGPEGHHLARVMRAQVGDKVALFDGSGYEFVAQITRVLKDSVELRIVERCAIDRELPFSLTLAVALPKGERQKWLVEKLVEIGVTRLIPLTTKHGVAQPVDSALERLSRGVVEASKQCGRNRLLQIAAPLSIAGLIAEAGAAPLRLVAHPDGQPLGAAADLTNGLICAIGPEGGFATDEVQLLESAGWRRVALGKSILRIETAAIAVAAWAALR